MYGPGYQQRKGCKLCALHTALYVVRVRVQGRGSFFASCCMTQRCLTCRHCCFVRVATKAQKAQRGVDDDGHEGTKQMLLLGSQFELGDPHSSHGFSPELGKREWAAVPCMRRPSLAESGSSYPMKLPCPSLAKIGGYRQSRRRKYDHVKDDLLDGGELGGAEMVGIWNRVIY